MLRVTTILLLLGVMAGCKQNQPPITRIAFGSCSNQDNPVQMWKDILLQKPELWILLGDNIYADTHDMAVMRSQYEKQKSNADYQKLINSCITIGTWDDHDYGINDGGKSFSKKEESKEEFLRFIGSPVVDSVRTHEGVYSSHTYGSGKKKIKVILLDTRTFRDTIFSSSISGRKYEPNPEGDILGEQQWQWLEKEFKNSDASIHIIGSSIQFISDEHSWEKWGNFPLAKERMIKLLVKYNVKIPIIISGDRHATDISKIELPGLDSPLYDFTSSGLTHVWPDPTQVESNKYRVGHQIVKTNFGMLLIDWSGDKPVVTMEKRGHDNQLFESHSTAE